MWEYVLVSACDCVPKPFNDSMAVVDRGKLCWPQGPLQRDVASEGKKYGLGQRVAARRSHWRSGKLFSPVRRVP